MTTGISVKAGRCQQCGCTDNKACASGCAWTNKKKNLCTSCAEWRKRAKKYNWYRAGRVRCLYCRKTKEVNVGKCLKTGWPECHGRIMGLIHTWRKKEKRKRYGNA